MNFYYLQHFREVITKLHIMYDLNEVYGPNNRLICKSVKVILATHVNSCSTPKLHCHNKTFFSVLNLMNGII